MAGWLCPCNIKTYPCTADRPKCIQALCSRPHVPTYTRSLLSHRQTVCKVQSSRSSARHTRLPGWRHAQRSLSCKARAGPEEALQAAEADGNTSEQTLVSAASDAQPRPTQAPQDQPKASTSGQTLRGYLYEPRYGLPVVRRKIAYGDLLRDIRQGRVKEISYFDNNVYEEEPVEYNVGVDGHCLVVYHDGLIAQSFIPPFDVRSAYAMETHGVRATKLCPPPGPEGVASISSGPGFLQGKFLALLPAALLLATYVAVQFAQWLKGDLEDRKKIREFDVRKEREAKQQAEADDIATEAKNLVKMGWDVDRICADLEEAKVPHSRAYIERLVEEEKARKEGGAPPEPEEPVVNAAQQAREQAMLDRMRKESEENMSEMEKAKELLKMRSVKIQKAIGPEDPEQEEMRIKMRKAQRQMKGVKLQYTDNSRVTFDDVAGIGDSKVELTEVVDFFVKPGRFKASGARVPKGVLLCGPPGTGKTLLARAVAGEARVAFLSLNASEFVEMFAGLGASRVRDLFAQARNIAPAIIFIDEIDAVGRRRGGASGNDERDQTLNQLLTEMDGFGEETGVIVMAATNRKDVLDSALVRPGRFDRIITVDLPDFDGRIDIMKVHLGYRPHADDIDLKELSFETQSFSGAQLANLINDAALVAAREDRDTVCMKDFVRALVDDRLGPLRRRAYSLPRQRRLAVQEGATALVCTLLPAIEPLISVTIIPREKFPLGQTVVKVNEQRERTNMFTRRYLEEQLLTVLAGRAAEELYYGQDEMSTMNQRRLVMARRIVTKLVAASAMTENDAIGPRTLSYPIDTGSRRLRQIVPKRVSAATMYDADLEMERVLKKSYEDVKDMIQRNRPALDAMIARLTTPEVGQTGTFQGNTLLGDEVRSIVSRYGDKSDLARRDAEAAVFM